MRIRPLSTWIVFLLASLSLHAGWTQGLEPKSTSIRQTALKPRALDPGDTILLIAPAGSVSELKVNEAVRNISRRGYRVRLARGCLGKNGYLAGPDEVRAADLNSAFADPEVKMILCLRGGYGSPRILDRLDYDMIRRNPKIFVGFSDISALLIGLRQKANLVTFHGPMAATDFSGKWGLAPFPSRYFWPLLEVPPNGKSVLKLEIFEDWGGEKARGNPVRRTLFPGVVEGPLIGGNLSTIAALMGTPFEIVTEGAILVLEDVNEEPFRIDRMLCQLQLAGKLRQCRGALLGAFTRCETQSKESFTVEQVLESYFSNLGVPVLSGFPVGHLPNQVTLPLGTRIRLDATRKTVTILELPVLRVTGTAGGD